MVHLGTGTSIRRTIAIKFPWEPASYLAAATVAGIVSYVAAHYSLVSAAVVFVLALPVPILVYYTFRTYRDKLDQQDRHHQEVTDINDSILEMLAMAIDAKDQTTHDHIQRVKLFARRMGEVVGLSEPEIEALKAGALLHDIGKIGVPSYILNKPGKLTEHEFEQMKLHTIIGADMLSNVNFRYPVVPIVRHHHERWDGKGYPDGLKGDQIPITARILTLVDNYDALRSDRPYHKAMSREEALEYIQKNAGAFFDPSLVEIFLGRIDELEVEAASFKSQVKKLTGVDSLALKTATPAAGLDTSTKQNRVTAVLNSIAESNQRVSALYELARNLAGAFSLEDTTAILTNRLAKIIPFTTCAVSLFDSSRSEFEIVHAIGRDGERFIKRRLPVSAGITGWVIQNQRPMYNTNPVLDLSYLGPDVASEYKAIMVVPLMRNTEALGAIALYSTDLASYSSEYIQLMESIAQPVSDSIHNALAFERAQRAAFTDPATGFANMRAFATHLDREQARWHRSGSPFSLVIATAENLTSAASKGGANEDEFMSLLGGLIKQRLRESDLIARQSTSSFVLLLSESGPSEALEVLARLHEEIAQHLLLADLSVVVGAASSPDDGEALDGLIKAARQRSLPVRDRISDLSPSVPDRALGRDEVTPAPTSSLM
jgi:diguanylate cyclase (GGDEF)-like protein/putative nucleotidyltransferase with HDIG domain